MIFFSFLVSVTSSLSTCLYWNSDTSIPTSMYSITECLNLRNFPQAHFLFFHVSAHCTASSLLGLEAMPSISLSPLSALLHTVAGVGFLESKSVIVILLFQHLTWLPIAWGLSPDTSGLSFVQTDVSGQL